MLKKKILNSPVSQFNIFILFHFFFSLFLSMFIYGKRRSFYIFRFFNFHNKIQQIMQCTNLAAFVCEQINIYITALQNVTITTQHKLGITLSLHVTVMFFRANCRFFLAISVKVLVLLERFRLLANHFFTCSGVMFPVVASCSMVSMLG